MISIHALREEGDVECAFDAVNVKQFLSTPSARRATFVDLIQHLFQELFLSTPSARRATSSGPLKDAIPLISIHALREEGDLLLRDLSPNQLCISIHALREEGDPSLARFRRWKADFYPRPPRGGRHCGHPERCSSRLISIHALREEGDCR